MERGAKERGATARATMVGVDPIARDDVAADDCGYSTPTSTDSVKGRGVSMAREWPRPAWGESRDGGACVTPLKVSCALVLSTFLRQKGAAPSICFICWGRKIVTPFFFTRGIHPDLLLLTFDVGDGRGA